MIAHLRNEPGRRLLLVGLAFGAACLCLLKAALSAPTGSRTTQATTATSPECSRPSLADREYDVSADWYEGAPLGNGDLGVIVFRAGPAIRYAIGKNDLWDRRYEGGPQPKPLCVIDIAPATDGIEQPTSAEPWSHCLSIDRAELLTRTPWVNARCFVAKGSNHIVLDLEAVKRPLRITLLRKPDATKRGIEPPRYQVNGPVASIVQALPASSGFPDGFVGALAAHLVNGPSPRQTGDGATWEITGPGTVVAFAATTRDAPDPARLTHQQAAAADVGRIESLANDHRRAWSEFWDTSWIRLSDEALERMWYDYLYLLNSATRPGAVAPGLYGPWIVEDTSVWRNSYTLDYNFFSNFAAALSCNHPELMGACFETFEAFRKPMQEIAAKLGRRGVALPHELWAQTEVHSEYRAPIETPLNLIHFWEHYDYTRDKQFLRDRAYPFIADTADFLASLAVRRVDGRYDLFPTRSMEHHGKVVGFDRNCIGTLALAQVMLDAAVRSAEVLELNEPRATEWRQVRDGLAAYPSMQTSAGRVWIDAQLARDELGVWPPVPMAASLPMRPSKVQGNHGAWMYYNLPLPLVPVWPAGQVDGFGDSAHALTAIRTWLAVKNEGTNDLVFRHVAAVRLGLHDLAALKEDLADRRLGNGLYTIRLNKLPNRQALEKKRYYQYWKNGLYIENCALPLVVNEMMLQSDRESRGGAIRLFPAIDPYLSAEFRHLRARGGFLVSGQCENGFVRWATIEPTVDGACKVALPWPAGALTLTMDGQPVAHAVSDGHVTFATQAGRVYSLTPRLATEEDLQNSGPSTSTTSLKRSAIADRAPRLKP